MKLTFKEDFLKELKDKNDILEVAKDYFDIKGAGNLHKTRCIHKGGDKTASLTFFPDTQSFYCFSCGAGKKDSVSEGSDVISLIQWLEDIPWQDAVLFLAKRVGLPLPKEQLSIEDKRLLKEYEQIFETNKNYWRNLMAAPCVDIEKWYGNRGIEADDIAKWRLGGSEYDGNWVPTYAIMDEQGRTCGFSMRTGTKEAKYINSPTSKIFKKGKILYGLNLIKKEIRAHKYIVLVEGYNDAIIMQKYGVPAVATMGTSLSGDQIELIKKYTNQVILFLDGDEAGIKSTITNIKELKKQGIDVDVINILGFDPDEVGLKYKDQTLNFILNNKKLAFQFLINNVLDRYFDKMTRLKKETIDELEEILNYIEDQSEKAIYRDHLVKIVSSEEKIRFT